MPVHHVRVTQLATKHGMFWILDELNGGHRLIDMDEMDINRLPANQATEWQVRP